MAQTARDLASGNVDKLDSLDSSDFVRYVSGGTLGNALANQAWVATYTDVNNVDHVWFDDTPNTYSFCADTTFKAAANANVAARQFQSTVATGTSPLTVSSTTVVTNLNADLLDGYHAATAGTANTIALRDTNADLTVRYLHSQYCNMTHAAAARNTDTVFYSSTDNYIRKNTAIGFKTSLALENVSNTSDANKPVSTAQQSALDLKANTTHKYHSFADEQYFFETYSQENYLRLFVDNAAYSATRFQPITAVEYHDGTAWTSWSGGDTEVKKLLDGREDTQSNIDHTHRRFRFEVTRASGWSLTALIVLQINWTAIVHTPITVTVETWNGSSFDVKSTSVFGSGTTGGDQGTHIKCETGLHDGITRTRVTIEINDWTDSGAYTTIPLKRFEILSQYLGTPLDPWTWDYDKVVNFKALPTINGTALKTSLSLNNVDNTSDANKPVSTAQQAALDLKANLASPTFTGTVTAPKFTSTQVTGTAPFTVASTTLVTNLNADQLDGLHATSFVRTDADSTIASNKLGFGAATRQMLDLYSTTYGIGIQSSTLYQRTGGGFAWHKNGVHSNTANDPGVGGTLLMQLTSAGALLTASTISGTQLISTTTGSAPLTVSSTTLVTNLNADTVDGTHASGFATSSHNHSGVYEPANANIQSHISSTLNPHSVTKAQVGLGNVDDTSDANKPVSTAQQTALDLKANLASPTFTGTVTAPKFTSTQVTGTAPFTVASTTLVTNLNADLLDGFQSSSAASNSTVVVRNASGYIYANFFNTTPNDVTSGVTKVCVETGNDGFIRHGDSASIRAFLGSGTPDSSNYLRGDGTWAAVGSTASQYTATTTATNKTLVNLEACLVTAAGRTITLPATPSAGTEVFIVVGDFTNTIVGRNSTNIMATAQDMTIDVANSSVHLMYMDATQGWRIL